MTPVCKSCARPLKATHIIKGGPKKVMVCRSPVCKSYNKPQ